MAINIREHTVYLCEVSYSKTLHALVRRLEAWSREWPKLCNAIVRDYLLSESEPVPWRFQPWVFVPETLRPTLTQRLAALASSSSSAGTDVMPAPKVYSFEEVGPWNFTPYNLTPRFTKPDA
jgi:hypothetical protein